MKSALQHTMCVLRIWSRTSRRKANHHMVLDVEGTMMAKEQQHKDPIQADQETTILDEPTTTMSQDTLNQALFMAVDQGDLNLVQNYLNRGANLECYDAGGSTPLARACFGGHLELVWYLLDERGANVHGQTPDPMQQGNTPLIAAATPFGNTKIVKLLLKHGADICVKNHFGETALHKAASLASVWQTCGQLLLKHCHKTMASSTIESLVNARDEQGRTALHKACSVGFLDAVTFLVEDGGARIDAGALHAACRQGHAEIVDYLLTTHKSSRHCCDADNNNKACVDVRTVHPETQHTPLETALYSEELYHAPRIPLLQETVDVLILQHGALTWIDRNETVKEFLAAASRRGPPAANVVYRMLTQGAAISLGRCGDN